jgi:polyhydroxyalkanoate synthesis regulator protein
VSIKKYPNRRLYDTETSTYVTIADVGERVVKGESVGDPTGSDATAEVLLWVIAQDKPTPDELRLAIAAYRAVRNVKKETTQQQPIL